LSAKRIREQFGEDLKGAEYPSKKAALDLADSKAMVGDEHAQAWVSDVKFDPFREQSY
jgi:hypothetical protein